MRKSRGFSLLTVLIITVMSLALMGSIVYIFTTTAASTRVDISQTDTFNIMQSGVERAKALLASESRGASRPLACTYGEMSSYTIEELDDLLIRSLDDPDDVIGRVISEEIAVGGTTFSYTVCIYDMRYSGATIDAGDPDATRALKAELPQLMEFVTKQIENNDPNVLAPNEGDRQGTGAGIYLIRATMTPKSGAAPRVVETAVVQALD